MYSKEGTLVDRREFLKIKIKSLVDEAKTIRAAEAKQKARAKQLRKGWTTKDGKVVEGREPNTYLMEQMRLHRIGIVRSETRHTLIAYGLIRGQSLEQIERKGSKPFDAAKVDKMVKAYGAVKPAVPVRVAMAA